MPGVSEVLVVVDVGLVESVDALVLHLQAVCVVELTLLVHALTVLPDALEHRPLIVGHLSFAVHLVVEPGTLEVVASDEPELAIAVPHVLLPLAFVDVAVWVAHFALPVTFALLPLPRKDAAVFVKHLAVALRHLVLPFALESISIRIRDSPDACKFRVSEVAFEHNPARKLELSLCEHIFDPAAHGYRAIGREVHLAATVAHVGHEVALVDVAFFVNKHPRAMEFVLTPLTLVPRATGEKHRALSVSHAIRKLATIFVPGCQFQCASALGLSMQEIAFVVVAALIFEEPLAGIIRLGDLSAFRINLPDDSLDRLRRLALDG